MKYGRSYNFSAGPAMMPEEVLEEIAAEMMNYQGSGMCVMEMSHRSAVFQKLRDEAENDLRKLMGIPVSTSQSVVGAVIGAGLVSGVKYVNFGVLKNVAIAWVSSPTIAGLLTWLVAICTKSYFG